MRLSKQTILLAGLGLLDLATTIWLVESHGAAEANPLMAWFLAQGLLAFIAAKLALLTGPLTVLEWARRKKPQFAARGMNLAVLGYLGLYLLGVARANAVPGNPYDNHVTPEAAAIWQQMSARWPKKERAPARSHYAESLIAAKRFSAGVMPLDDVAPQPMPGAICVESAQVFPQAAQNKALTSNHPLRQSGSRPG